MARAPEERGEHELLVLLHDYLPEHAGGTEIHAHQVARELVRRGHDVTALFTERDLSAPEGDVREGELDGVRTLEMVHQHEYADVRDSWREPLSAEVFRAVLRHERPDAVHAQHLAFWGTRCLAVAREEGVRAVLTLNDFHLICDRAVLLTRASEHCTAGLRGECIDCLHGKYPLYPDRWGELEGRPVEELWRIGARERFEQHRAHLAVLPVAICPSRFLADVFVGAGLLREEQVVVTKYGYPGPRRAPRSSDPAAPLRVGYAGGLYPSKGVHVLVDAIARLPPHLAELSVWGALDWFPDYAADLRARAAGHAVTFHGKYEPARVDDVLSGFDVLVVPSLWYENMPLTIQEAFRLGVPVVATDQGGMAEAVEHELSGLRFPRGDARALAACLERLARDRALLLKLAQGRPRVPELAEVVDLLEGLYR